MGRTAACLAAPCCALACWRPRPRSCRPAPPAPRAPSWARTSSASWRDRRSSPTPPSSRRRFKEAPQLAELVKAGKLPPVEQRIGQDPLVVKPLREIGKYGGTWRRGFTGPFDTSNGHRVAQNDKLLFFDYTGTKIVPNIARGWEVSPDGKVTTLAPAPRDEVERRPAVHRRRLRLLVRGRVPEQGSGPDPARRSMTINGKPIAIEKVRRQHRPVRLARPLLRAADRAGLRVGHRAPRAVRAVRPGRLRARPLPEAVPSEVRSKDDLEQEGRRAEVRQLGHAVQEPQRRLPQPRPAGRDALEDDLPDQHAARGPSSGTRTACGSTPTGTSFRTSTGSR